MGVVSRGDVARPGSNSVQDLANPLTVGAGCLRPSPEECGRPRRLNRRGLAGRQSEGLAVVSGDAQPAVDGDGDGGCLPVVDVASKIDISLGLVIVKGYECHTSGDEGVAVELLSFTGRIEWVQPQHLGGDDSGHEEPDVGRQGELAEVNTRREEVESDAGVEEKVVHDTYRPGTSAVSDLGSVKVSNLDLRDGPTFVHTDSM